jgi:hypothetical protein
VKITPFLIVTAIVEIAVGLLLLLAPAGPLSLLLGIEAPAVETEFVTRWLGAALISIGVASAMARDDRDTVSLHAVIVGVVVYDLAAVVLFVLAGTTMNLAGPALWPAALLHTVLGVWGLLCLRAESRA